MNPELARQHARVQAARARIHAGVPRAPVPVPEPEPRPAPPATCLRSFSAPHAQHVADYRRVLRARGPVGARVEDVLDVVCEVWRAAPDEVRTRTMRPGALRARRVAMYLLRRYTTRTYAEIGKGLGGRDHSTCVKAWREVSAELDLGRNASLARRVAACLRRLGLDGAVGRP